MSVDLPGTTYSIVHTTEYQYSEPVSLSHHVARLTPRNLAHQTCDHHEIDFQPAAAVVRRHVDYYGNATTFFAMQSSHRKLTVRGRSTIRVLETTPPASDGPMWEQATDLSALPLDAIECTLDDLPAPMRASLADYARPSFSPGRPLLSGLAELTSRIHGDFTYDPAATTVATSLAQVFDSRRGVCQDFARLEIACLRSIGIPARYVSGYLETLPPPGEARLVGADASHAWLAAYGPGIGWVDVDPTNDRFPDGTHVTLAWGRDYADVSPTRGIIVGGGSHSLRVSVDVVRLDRPAGPS